jgi:CDP-glucose 4,6-dehydratase
MGGYDPYSSSKGAAELVIAAYRRSFFGRPDSPIKVASARAGNVIGGGDWALDRIVPDCIRSLKAGAAIPVRNKVATRPWQHVLEPLSGYLWLAACLQSPRLSPNASGMSASQLSAFSLQLSSAFNFGPSLSSNKTVAELVRVVLKHWPGKWEDRSDPKAVHEASLLNLSTDKAHHLLGWSPVWDFETCVGETVEWYRRAVKESANELTRSQLREYVAAAGAQNLSWPQTSSLHTA